MDFKIVIPTHGRANRQITLKCLPEKVRKDVTVVTSTREDGLVISKDYPGVKVIVAKGTTGIANKRHWIMKNVKADHIFFMDDDLDFYVRCAPEQRYVEDGLLKLKAGVPPDTYLLGKPRKGKAVEEVFTKWLPKMALSYPVTGLSSRMGNNRVPEQHVENTRVMHAFGVDTAIYKGFKMNFEAVRYREDMHIALSFLRLGYPNTVYYDVCCAPGNYGAPGGTSLQRTTEDSDADAYKLAELHPGLVKVVERNYKETPRKEVVVSWKKAFAEGRAKNA